VKRYQGLFMAMREEGGITNIMTSMKMEQTVIGTSEDGIPEMTLIEAPTAVRRSKSPQEKGRRRMIVLLPFQRKASPMG